MTDIPRIVHPATSNFGVLPPDEVPLQFDCVACAGELYAAEAAGAPDDQLPAVAPARVIAGGNGVCYRHIQFGPMPVAPGRTASGIVLPGAGV